MNDPNAELDLFKLGQHYLDAFIQEFAAYGIHTGSDIELCRGTGMLCYYDLEDGHIYLSLPDLDTPAGKLHMLFLRSLLSCQSNQEVAELFRLLLPQVVAHELAHCFRHRRGLFTDDLWHEEQIANQLAAAVTEHRLAPAERQRAVSLLKRARDGLAAKLGIQEGVADDAYYSIWQAFGIDGQIEDRELEYLELAQQVFAIDPAEMLQSSGHLSEEISRRLEHREELIDEINEQYASDYVRYMYYQLGWLYLELTSPERQYVEAFARNYLELTVPLLPPISEGALPDESAILACFKAYQETAPHSEAGSRYFYKRYRSLLLARLQFTAPTRRFPRESAFILQGWDGQGGETDMLAYLTRLAPPPLQVLFPHQIVDHPELQLTLCAVHLPTETDRRLWRHICTVEEDPRATNTLARLALLERIEVFRALPAEVMLELSHSFCRIKLAAGETIIWQGERNDDVYVLIEGSLDVFDGGPEALDTIEPGEVFGQIAFLTNQPRNTTVRATEKSECFVLKDTDLHILAFKYPVILMHIARGLATRLAEMIEMHRAIRQPPAVHLETR